jgi:NADH-ubiquinone oxidoreductase chain 4
MFNRIAFAGSINFKYWLEYLPDLNRREFFMLLVLVLFTIILGIYPSIILDGLNYYSYNLLYSVDFSFR